MNKLVKIFLFGCVMLLLWTGQALADGVPEAPDNLKADTYSSSRIDVTWDDNSSNESSFVIYRKKGSSGSYNQIGTVSSGTEKYKDTDVDEDTKYYYKVRAYNGYGYSEYSNEDYATTDEDDDDSSGDLDAPDDLEADAHSSSRIDLTWKDNSNDETKFYIYRKTSGGSYDLLTRVSEDTEEYSDTDLDEDTKYYYKVRAYDGDDYSDYSNEAYATTDEDDDDNSSDGDLDAPDNLEAEAYSSSGINLTWDDNSSAETKFEIYRKTTSSGEYVHITSVTKNTKQYSDTGLKSDTKYYYKVRAYDGDDYSYYSNESSATTKSSGSSSDLGAPDNLEAKVYSTSRIDLTWDDNSSGETKFYIYRKTGSNGTYSQIANVSSNTEKYKDTSLSSGTKYYYKVRAYDGDEYSDYSNEDSATTEGSGDELDAPTNLSATIYNGSVRLTWSDNASSEAAYVIERQAGSGAYTELTWLGPNITTYNDATATGGASYSYRVRAYSANGYSDYSNIATLQTSSQIGAQTPSTQGNQLRFTTGKRVYSYKGQQYNMDTAPVNLNNRVMIPIRYVTDQLGANVSYDASTKKVTITYNGKTIELWAGNRTAKVNSVNKYIDSVNNNVTPVIVPPGRILVPIRFVSENLGCTVSWETATNTAVITLP